MRPHQLPVLISLLQLLPHLACSQGTSAADFIIIGGGTAGCALAARLCTGLPDQQVVLLERGVPRNQTEDLLVSSPRLAFDAWASPNIMETIQSAPIPGLNGQRVTLRVGKTKGGSSAINGCHWTQPPGSVPAAWKFTGLTAKVAERLYAKAAKQIGVATAPKDLRQTYVEQWLTAAGDAGITRASEAIPAGIDVDRAWVNSMTADSVGRRRDSCTAYVDPVIAPGGACAKNLRVVLSATVSKIVTKDKRAVAVEWLSPGAAESAKNVLTASKEVILSAGPFGSPKILQLSGIGPAKLLSSRGVPLVADLPVGEATTHRPFSFLIHSYTAPLVRENTKALVFSKEAAVQFRAGMGGPLGIGVSGADGVLAAEDSIITHATAHPPPEQNSKQFASGCFLNSKSTGSIAIKSTDPLQPPDVQPNLFASKREVDSAIACLNRHLKVCSVYSS
jgi:choline dehydrogenase